MLLLHICGNALNFFILTCTRKLITLTTVKHPMATELKNMMVQKIIRDYHSGMHAVIVKAVVVDSENEILFIINENLMDLINSENVAYNFFEKHVDVDEAVECNSAEIEADICMIGILALSYSYPIRME